MTISVYDNSFKTLNELGYNLLDKATPQILGIAEGVKAEAMGVTGKELSEIVTEDILNILTDDRSFEEHIDIPASEFYLLYDLKGISEFDSLYFNCFCDPYQTGKFEIYTSNSLNKVFEPESKIIEVNNETEYCAASGVTRSSSFYFAFEKKSARFIAFKQISTNDIEDISRITNFGIYSKRVSDSKYYLRRNNIDKNILDAEKIDNKYISLVDGIVFDNNDALKNAENIKLELKNENLIDHIIVIGVGIEDCTVVLNDNSYYNSDVSVEKIEYARTKVVFKFDEAVNCENISISFNNSDNLVDQVIAFNQKYKFDYNDKEVINDNFLGVGTNVIPEHLFPGSLNIGYDNACFELEKCRIAKLKPAVVRVWFQIDWFIMDEADYYGRKYVFNSRHMQAFYKEIDAYLENNVDVELNFGWKTSIFAQEWFVFQDIGMRDSGAPRDLKQFAIVFVDLIRELIINRGYKNIKYVSFFNEAECARGVNGYDFLVPDKQPIPYWIKMLSMCNKQIEKEGLSGLVEIWGAENSLIPSYDPENTLPYEWINALSNSENQCDRISLHFYRCSYQEATDGVKLAKEYSGGKPVCITEYGIYSPLSAHRFDKNNICLTIAMMNAGADALLYWYQSGCFLEETMKFDGGIWSMPMQDCGGINAVGREFYELSLFTNYAPAHSRVIDIENAYDDIHITAVVTPQDDISFFVESAESAFEKNFVLKFVEKTDRVFYKYIYNMKTATNGNAIVCPCSKQISVEDVLSDTLESGYSLTVYSTKKPRKQVVMNDMEVTVKPDESRQLIASVIDGDKDENIHWSLCDCYYPFNLIGSITESGLYTAPPQQGSNPVNKRIAIKAELAGGEYAVCLVYVKS